MNNNKLVVVDTNCLVRIYFSSLRPLLGQPASGYVLNTLAELAAELRGLAKSDELAWLSDPGIQKDVAAGLVELSRKQKETIRDDARGIRDFSDGVLRKHCEANKTVRIRALSLADAKALAATLELQAALATDEWALRHIADLYDGDDGNPVELFSSVELLRLLEKEGLLSREERIQTYRGWLRDGANLLKGSNQRYFELFDEAPPTAQS